MGSVVLSRVVLLLLFGLCSLLVAPEVPIQPDFDLQKFSGEWYPISAVANQGDVEGYVSRVIALEAGTNGQLIWRIEFPIKGKKCRRKKFRLLQVDQPGKYRTEGQNILRIVETDYTSYYVLHRENQNIQVLELYARAQGASDEVKENFKNLATSLGFSAGKISPTRLADPCPEPKIT